MTIPQQINRCEQGWAVVEEAPFLGGGIQGGSWVGAFSASVLYCTAVSCTVLAWAVELIAQSSRLQWQTFQPAKTHFRAVTLCASADPPQ